MVSRINRRRAVSLCAGPDLDRESFARLRSLAACDPFDPDLKPIVIIESPFKHADRERNLRYARAAMYDSVVRRCESALASHLLYPQILDDNDAAERMLGFMAARPWYRHAACVAFYIDLGISKGMQSTREFCVEQGLVVQVRHVPGNHKETT